MGGGIGPRQPGMGGIGGRGGERGPGGFGGPPSGPPGGFGGPPSGGGFMPGVPGQPGQAGEEDEVEITPLYVVAVVELKGNPIRPQLMQVAMQGQTPLKITHKWGTTWLKAADNLTFFPLEQGRNQLWPSLTKAFEKKYYDAHRDGASETGLLQLADFALSRGLMKDFHRVMEELVKLKPDSPQAKDYQRLKAELERPAASNPDAEAWKSKLGIDGYKSKENEKGHYTLIHNLKTSEAAEAQSRLDRLENAFQSYYYWFALQAHAGAVKVPSHRLLAILVAPTDKGEFTRMHDIFGDPPLVADGFVARRDNLAVLSAQRRDDLYESLRSTAETTFRDMDPGTLLKGRNDPKTYDAQTMALLLKALDEDGELATVTHEGPRQLLAASGLLPRDVEIPQWIQFGMGSFFETSKGSPWPTLGDQSASLLDSNNYFYTYKTWLKGKKLDPAKVALEKVITDRYFRLADELVKNGKDDPTALHRARTMSWALAYFLAHTKLDGLLNYYRELSQLPRDLRFDDQVLMLTFARGFGLTDRNNPNQVDPNKFAEFASQWESYLKRKNVEMEPAIKLVHQAKPKPAEQQNNPYGGGGSGQ
jgi:hypothetical protein